MWEALSDQPYADTLSALARPLKIGLQVDWKFGLHLLPDRFVQLLCEMDQSTLHRHATAWAATEEMQSDGATVKFCEKILHELQELATLAGQDKLKNMYYAGMI